MAISDHLRLHAANYFPEFRGAPVAVRCVRSQIRDVTEIHHYVLSSAGYSQKVIVKIALVTPRRRYDRTLESEHLDSAAHVEAEPLHEYEYRALLAIDDFFSRKGDPRFGTIRPLDCISSERALVLENRDEPTLMNEVLRYHRLRSALSPPQLEEGFHNTGEWLRCFHAFDHVAHQLVSMTTRDQLNASIKEMINRLAEREGLQRGIRRRFLASVLKTTEQLAQSVLPEQLPTVLAHGDFGPHNVFVDSSGNVIVFDTMGRTRMAPYRDIAYFLFVLKSRSTENYWRRMFYGSERVIAYENAFLAGYFQEENIPIVAIRLFEIHAALHRWLARAESQERAAGMWKAVKKARMALRERTFMAYIQRLLQDASEAADI